MSGRRIGVVTALLLAPITAELLQAYLGDLGGPIGLAFVVLFFAPLYGGAVLLIREVSVRTGRGWTGRLLLATAFGVAMPTVIDVSFFTPVRDDIDDWSTIFSAASWLGIGWYSVVTWVGGHVLMSISAPMIVAESLARDPRPWLGRVGLGVVAVGFVGWAVLIHSDSVSPSMETSVASYAVSGLLIAGLVALALSPLGLPLRTPAHARRVPRVWLLAVLGLVGMAVFDFVPIGWAGVAVDCTVLAVVGVVVLRWSRRAGWSQQHLAALAFGAILARTGTGFLSPPPHGTTQAEKLVQNGCYLAVVLLLGLALMRRTREPAPRSA